MEGIKYLKDNNVFMLDLKLGKKKLYLLNRKYNL